MLLLTVRDTGSRGGREGLSDTQNQDPTPGSLDTELVRILVEQLNGSSRVFEENGFEYQIRFPASQ